MRAATDLTESSWKVFSALLDRALELAPPDRLAWLDALDAEHEALKPALRSVLQRSAGAETAQWLDTLPRTPDTVRSPDDSDLQPNALVGPYRLLRELGVGGMGAVWLAERADGTLKRQVALKLPRAVWSSGLAQRMMRERDILASLEHPNIARLYDAGTDAQGRPFLALEYVEGQPIDVYCRERVLNVRSRLALLLQVARAVAFAHSRLVVHRDLKPSNILVTADGQVRLLDFGIAKLMEGDRTQETQLTRLAGQALTLDYASPEQIRGEPIGTASDVYSFGVVSYELLAGAKPYKLKRQTAAQLEDAIAAIDAPLASATATDPAAKRDLRGDLDAILNKALKKNSNERYATVDALSRDIESHLAGHRVIARPDSLAYRIARLARRHQTPLIFGSLVAIGFALALGVGATAVVMAALATGAAAAIWQARSALRARDRALRSLQRQEAVQQFLDTVLTEAARGGESFTGRQLYQRCEALADREFGGSGEVPAMVLSLIGSTMHGLGEVNEAVRLHERALAASRDTDDPGLHDTLLSHWAMSIAWTGRVDEARSTLAAVLKRDVVTVERRSEVHSCLAALAESQSDAAAALHHAERALQDQRRCIRQSRHEVAIKLATLGGALSLNGRMAEAERYFGEAYAMFEAIGREGSARGLNVLNNWSVINERAGDARRALALADRALASGTTEAPRSPFIVSNRARALEQLGRWNEAEVGYIEALQLAERLQTPPVRQFAQAGLAWLALERGEIEKAREWYTRGEVDRPPPNSKAGLLLGLVQARLQLQDDDLAVAVSSLTALIGERLTLPSTVNALLLRSTAQQRAGLLEAALADARAARNLARRLQGDKPTSVRTGLAWLAIAQLLSDAGKADDARRESAQALRQLQDAVDADHPALEQARALLK